MLSTIKFFYRQHPLRFIIFAALVFRVISAIFSRGYGFSDDHFLVIEVAQQWVDGIDNKGWMPWNGNTTASGHSLFYPGIHYLLLLLFKSLGIADPEIKMLLIRLLHALYSLTIVYYGYRIAWKIAGEEAAKVSAWLLALFWFIPMMSVRNSVEMVCIPPLMIAAWMLIKADSMKIAKYAFYAGLIAGISFSIRFQTMMFIGGFGLVLLFQKKFKQMFLYGAGALLSMILIQGGIDLYIWGRPFAEFTEYTLYNWYHSGEYHNGPWYQYILLLSGIMIPPVSLFIFSGMFTKWRKYLLLFLPAMLFFIFHSYFPNKQERFVLPVVPFFVIAGIGGWLEWMRRSGYWHKHHALYRNILVWFWSINILLLVLVSPASTKISRVDVMNYMRSRPDGKYVVLETTHMWGSVLMPMFYANSWEGWYKITQESSAAALFDSLHKFNKPLPQYIVFAEPKQLDERIAKVKEQVKGLTLEAEITSSYLDRAMSFLNPVNVNQTYYIYKITY